MGLRPLEAHDPIEAGGRQELYQASSGIRTDFPEPRARLAPPYATYAPPFPSDSASALPPPLGLTQPASQGEPVLEGRGRTPLQVNSDGAETQPGPAADLTLPADGLRRGASWEL